MLPKQIKAAIQLVSSNMRVIIKILRSNLVALSLIIMDALSTMLQLLREKLEEAS